MKANKVQFNLRNAHYALLKIDDSGNITFDTPVPIPGAVNISLEAQGEVTPFYADGITYYQSQTNNGYSGDLEVAKFPDQMMTDVWKMEITETDKVIIEKANVEFQAFALLFEIDGDQEAEKYCLYNCMGTRPAIASTTNTETKEPQTQSSSVTALPLENNLVRARTSAETPAEVKANWYKKVWMPTVTIA